MRSLGIGLAAVLAVVAFAPAAVSQGKKAPEITEKQRTQGMAEAPALARAAGVACTVSDARFIGKVSDKKAKTATNYYEVDCDQGLGFIVQAAEGGQATVFSCIEANTPQPDGKPPSLPCMLPGNADPKSDLAPLIAAAKVQCTPEQVRGIGQSATATYMELACQGSTQGFILKASTPIDAAKPVEATDCMLYDEAESNIKCTLRTKDARLQVIDTYVAAAKNGCQVKDRKYVGMSQGGATYFEAACTDGKGYMYKVDKGALTAATECAKSTMIMGGCTLTDAKEAITAQNDLYTRLAKGVNFDCAVSKYAPFPSPAGKDVVELSCGNRPDGGVGIFGATAAQSQIVDCARAPIAGYKCSFTKPDAAYNLVTADLKKHGKNDCAVSNTRMVGKTAKGTAYFEVACADGLKGYVIEYEVEKLNAIAVIGCAFAGSCKLPGNT